MTKRTAWAAVVALALAGGLIAGVWSAAGPSLSADDDIFAAGCSLTGGGKITSGVVVTMSARVQDGVTMGHVRVVTPEGDQFTGRISFLQCRRDGGGGPGSPEAIPNIGTIVGEGSWNRVPGHPFRMVVKDHGEGTLDIRLADDLAGSIAAPGGTPTIYSFSGLVTSGNIQIHPPNPAHP